VARPLSVRAQVTLWGTLVAGVALVVAALALMGSMERQLTTTDDEVSQARAHEIGVLASAGTLPSVLQRPRDDSMEQVVDSGGRVLAASVNVARAGPVARATPAAGHAEVAAVRGPDDEEVESYRVWAVGADTPHGMVTVYVGTSLESVGEAMATLRRTLLVGLPLLVVLLGLGTTLLVGRAFAPIDRIRTEVDAISAASRGRRVTVPRADDEVGRLAMTMNQMLGRMEVADLRQREFTGNAAHELQGPLAAIRAQLEVALAHPERSDWTQTATDVLADAMRLERLVKDLLFLARADSADAQPFRVVRLDQVVREEAARLGSVGYGAFDLSGVAPAVVAGHRGDLGTLARNLLDNGARHARTAVRVGTGTSDGEAWLEVSDDGEGVPVDERERIFERFHRIDAARPRGRGGSGLGLAIARAVAVRHGGTLVLADSGAERGARFFARFPAVGADVSSCDGLVHEPPGGAYTR
jgi:signal transduction histidine kinase